MFATYPNYNKMEKILEKLSPEGMTICPTESCDPYFVGCGIDEHQVCNSDSFCLGDDFDHCMAMT